MLASLATPRPPRTRIPSLLIAAALHAVLLGLILYHQPASLAHTKDAPIMVSFITPAPARVEPPQPKPEPPKPVVKPKPVAKAKAKPIITSKRPEPAPFVAPPEPKPEPRAEEAPPPPPPVPKIAEAPAPAPVAPPRFSADYLRNPKPAYPGLSRRLHEEGTVVLRVYVSPQGSPERVELNKSSGYARLDESALETIKQHWKFVPARQGDTPVGGWVLVPIAFTLQG